MRTIHFMKSYFFFFVMACLLPACGSDPETTGTASTPQEAAPVPAPHEIKPTPMPEDAPSPDEAANSDVTGFGDEVFINGLLKLLDGTWQNSSDPQQTLVFSEKKLRYFLDNKQTRESSFEIDPRCEKSECKGSIGWCFIDDKGCHVVTQVDVKKLVFRDASDKTSDFIFNKVEKQ